MPRKRYRTIAIPEELYEKCEKIVKEGNLGYSSVSEFVKEAIRKRLEELNAI
jgi:Arc/MetJ-type ribon-helix-helix transcriptional regulator